MATRLKYCYVFHRSINQLREMGVAVEVVVFLSILILTQPDALA